MDSEIVKELNEQIRELNDALKKQTSELSGYTSSLANSTQATKNNTNAVNTANNATHSVAQGMTRYGQIVAETDKTLQEQNVKFVTALKATGVAALGFAKTLVSADTSLNKYGDVARSAGGQAWEVGKNFGALGMVIGGVLGGLGLAAGSILSLNQNIVEFRDGFAKQAGVLPVTTEELGKLASEAGFAYKRMPMLAKTVQNLGPSLMSLGGYAGEGAVRFMRIADVGEEVRKKFSRMGLQQQDLLEYQSYYVELQRSSGNAAANRRKTDQQIQRESLQYAENLLELSALTGEKASTIQDREKQVTENIQEQARIANEEFQIKELEKLGTPAAFAEIKKKRDERLIRQTLMRRTAVERGVRAGEEHGSIYELKGVTSDMAGAVLTGTDRAIRNIKGLEDINGALEQIHDKSLRNINMVDNAGEHDKALLEKMANLYSGEDLNTVLRLKEQDQERIKRDLAEKGKSGDPLAEAAASIQELEILASQKFQAFLETIDPLRMGFEKFLDAATIAAALLGGGALIAGVAKLIGGKFGELGSPNNPMHVKFESGPTAAAPLNKGIGARLKGLFSKTADPVAAAAGVGAASSLGKSATGAAALSSAAGSAGGSKVGIFLTGLSTGLKTLSNPKILVGATILGGSITIIGAGIAGATWLIGKTLPSLATGLQAFDKVDGDKLSKIGTGMAGMAAGLLAIGGPKIPDVIGSFAAWASGDDSNHIDKLQTQLTDFQNLEVEPGKIERNSKAFIAFNKMLAESTEISGTVAGALSRAFGSFFKVELPLAKFKIFSDMKINAEQVGENATAFKLFAEAIDSYKGQGSLDALGTIARALSGSVFGFYQSLPSDDPINRFEKFSKISIDGLQATINAGAFKDFANAIAEYKGGPGVIEALGQLAGGALMSLFNVNGPIDAFRKFAQEDFGPNMEKNINALTAYSNSKSSSAAPSSDGGGGGDGSAPSSDGGGGAPAIGAGQAAVLEHAQSLPAASRAEYFRSLANQGMQNAAAARTSGNSAQSALWEKAASQYQLVASSAESDAQSGSITGRHDIVSLGKELQRRGLRITEHPSFGGVSNVHKGRGHYEGRAIDINAVAGRDADNPRAAATLDKLKIELEGKGLKVLWRTHGHYSHMHAEVPKARAAAHGGIFSETPEMVGNGIANAQKIGMLNPQSLISKLGKTAAIEVPDIINPVTTNVETDLTPELLSMIEGKLEKVLYALENNQDTHERILKSSM